MSRTVHNIYKNIKYNFEQAMIILKACLVKKTSMFYEFSSFID